jgi:hypothetical protein
MNTELAEPRCSWIPASAAGMTGGSGPSERDANPVRFCSIRLTRERIVNMMKFQCDIGPTWIKLGFRALGDCG